MSELDQNQQTDEPVDIEYEPLDRPWHPVDIDWGGDGSDLDRPVHAHVLAALQPAADPYLPPLDALLTLGDVPDTTLEQRAAELGIGQQHVPELVRMLRDRVLATSEEHGAAAWAPVHALQILARHDISHVVADLLPIFDLDFNQMTDELIEIVAAVGPDALPSTIGYLHDRTRWAWGRARVADVLQTIAAQHPATRQQVIAALSVVLAGAEADHEPAITGALGALIDLHAAETVPLIRHAFVLGKIDETVHGPWDDVLERMGLEPEPDDPLVDESRSRFVARNREMFPPGLIENLAAFQQRHHAEQARGEQRTVTKKRKQDHERRQKNKRKAASATRKANRKKR